MDTKTVEFVQKVLRRKIAELKMRDTPACQKLSESVKVSHATLLKVLKGEVTRRTVLKMMNAGWFTKDELVNYRNGVLATPKASSEAVKQNNNVVGDDREKAAFKRGYDQGLRQAVKVNESTLNGAVRAAYDRGLVEGRTAGFNQGYERGRQAGLQESRRTPVSTPAGIDVDRLKNLFNMTVERGAAQGEVVAARKAAGKTIAKWIREKFGQDVQVNLS